MINILDVFRNKVKSFSLDDRKDEDTDNLIALGVLLWAVAEADEKFLQIEKGVIEEALRRYSDICDEDMPVVLRAVKEASIERIDFYQFAKEASRDMKRGEKIRILENLFRVACSDRELAAEEEAVIRQISGLFGLDHSEYISAKLKVKKEFDLDTGGL